MRLSKRANGKGQITIIRDDKGSITTANVVKQSKEIKLIGLRTNQPVVIIGKWYELVREFSKVDAYTEINYIPIYQYQFLPSIQ